MVAGVFWTQEERERLAGSLAKEAAGFAWVHHCPASFNFLFCGLATPLHSKGLGPAAMLGPSHLYDPCLAWAGPQPLPTVGWAHKSIERIQAEYPPRHLDPPSPDSPSQGPADTLAGAF